AALNLSASRRYDSRTQPSPSAPGRDPRRAIKHFRDPKPCALCGLRRQRRRIVEPARHDLAVGLRQAVLPELPDNVDRDMVAAGDVAVEKQAMQVRLVGQFDLPLLHQFAPQRFEEGFADLDPSAWQMPAGDIAVL